MIEPRPWNLVAPWYHWHRQLAELGLPPRQTRPVFQKFDHSDFVKGFTKDPQRSLKFQDDVDRVFNVKLTDVPKPVSGPFVGKFTRIYAPNKVPKNTSLIPTGIRKIYLDTHKRYYLVVCELHCDAPGFPMTTPDQVCQAGFVVRRRRVDRWRRRAIRTRVKTMSDTLFFMVAISIGLAAGVAPWAFP